MHIDLSKFPEGTRATYEKDTVKIYGADGREWALIIGSTPYPTNFLPKEYRQILNKICNS